MANLIKCTSLATDETLHPLRLFDTLKVTVYIALVSFFSEIFTRTFWGWNFFQETVGSHLKSI